MSGPPPPADGAPGAGWGPSSYDRDPSSRGPAPYGHQDARAQPGITGDSAGAGRYGGSGSHDGGAGPRYGGYGGAPPPPPPSSSYGAPGGYGQQQYGQPGDRYGAPPGDDRGARRPGPRYQQRDLDNINLARGMDKLRIGKHEAITRTLQATREDGGQEEIKDYDEEDDPLHSGMEFTDPDLGIPNRVLKGIQAAGLTEASVIQSLTIPYFTAPLKNPSAAVHVIAQARSGSGKSAAFVTGLLSILEDQLQGPQAIILAPTRELVLQTYDWVRSLGRDMGMTTEQLVTLGLPDNGRFLRQRVTAQVVVGTPATVSNALGQAASINARNVRMLVLDEADQLLYMSRRDQESEQSRGRGGGRGGGSHSHAPACHKVRDAIERSHQRDAPPCRFALFSATFSPSMLNRVRLFVPRTLKSEMIKLADNEVMVDEIAQLYVDLRELTGGRDIWREDAQRMKEDFVQKLLTKRTQTGKVIIFVQSRHGCQSLAARLSSLENMKTSEFHGGLDPGQRDEYFDLFMMGSTNILVATDVLARGVDISGVSMVINFDMPYEEGGRRGYVGESTEEANATETYVHRVGRTGRFGANGTAVSLIATQQDDGLRLQVEGKYGDRGSGEPIIHRVPSDDVSEIERKAQEVCETVARKRKQRRRAQRLAEEAAMSSAPPPPGAPADAMANNTPQDLTSMPTADPMAPIPPTPTPM